MVFVQCQNFGGENSAVTKNGKRKQTAYAWRNTTVGYNIDVFYNTGMPNAQKLAQQWQDTNIAEGVGPNGKFSTADHRWFWASHGDLDMSKVWPFYYSKADYEKCCKVKQTEALLDDAAFAKERADCAVPRAQEKGIASARLLRPSGRAAKG